MSMKGEKTKQHIPAAMILEELLLRYATEMIDSENSINLAIYEFYSNPAISEDDNSVKSSMKFQNQHG